MKNLTGKVPKQDSPPPLAPLQAATPGPTKRELSSTHPQLIAQAAVLQVRHAAAGDAEVPAGKDLVAVTLEVLLTPDQVDFEPFHRT